MQIKRYELAHVPLAYRRPVNWFNSSEDHADCVILRLFGEGGAIGVAEAPVRRTWGGKTVAMMMDAVTELFLPALAGVDLDDAARLDAALNRFPDNHLPRMLCDNAVVALKAARAGEPLWRYLGGAPTVEASWCLTRQSVDAMVREASEMVDRFGFRTLKIKGGQGWRTDREVVRALRAALGPATVLTVDANAAYQPEEALDYVAMLAEETVALAEDPCALEPGPFLGHLSAASPIPLLVDMPCLLAQDVEALTAAGAGAVSVKPGRVGFTEAARMNALAAQKGVAVCSGTYGESALGSLVSLSQASTLAAPIAPAEQTFFLIFAESVLREEIAIAEGCVRLPEGDLDGLVDWPAVGRMARATRSGAF